MKEMTELAPDERGRIRIPEHVCESLGLEPGMTLVVEPAGSGGVELRIRATAPEIVSEGGAFVVNGEAACDLNRVVEDERERRIQFFIGPAKQ